MNSTTTTSDEVLPAWVSVLHIVLLTACGTFVATLCFVVCIDWWEDRKRQGRAEPCAQGHGVPAELGDCALRLSVGWNSTEADIAAFLDGFGEVLQRHRERRNNRAA